jgi:hypothetical protein
MLLRVNADDNNDINFSKHNNHSLIGPECRPFGVNKAGMVLDLSMRVCPQARAWSEQT